MPELLFFSPKMLKWHHLLKDQYRALLNITNLLTTRPVLLYEAVFMVIMLFAERSL